MAKGEITSGSVKAEEAEALLNQDATKASQTDDTDNVVDDDDDDDSFFVEVDDGSMSLNDFEESDDEEPEKDEPEEPESEEEEEPEQSDEESEPEPEKEPQQKHEFDKQRQQEQIELANTRRRLQEREMEIQEMKKALLKKNISPPAEDDEKVDIDNIDDDPIDVLRRQNEVMKRQEKEIAEINRRLESYANLEMKRAEQNRRAEESLAYDRFFKDMDNKYGAENRNAAKEYAQAFAKEAGYTLNPNDDNGLPSFTETLSYIRAGFLQARTDAAERARQEINKPKKRQDVAKTGRTVAKDSIKDGSFEDVSRQMEKEGYFDNLFNK